MLHGFGITNFADEIHIRSLPQCRAQRRGKVRRIASNLNLLDDAADVRMLVLDRIFDRYNVARLAPVDLVHQRRQRRRFPRAGRPANQHKPAPQVRERFHLRGQTQFRQVRDLRRQRANRSRRLPAFAMHVDAESPVPVDAVGRIGNLVLAKLLQRARSQHRQHEVFDFRSVERRRLDRFHGAFDQHRSRRARHQQQIAAAVGEQAREPTVHLQRLAQLLLPCLRRVIQLAYDLVEFLRIIHKLLAHGLPLRFSTVERG